MKNTINIFIIILAVSLTVSCKKNLTIEFCEGVAVDGKGVKCGETFSTGELTALIRIEEPFTVNKLGVNIYKKGKYKLEKVETLSIDVKPEESAARTNFYMYDEGEFTVEVIGKENKKIAEGIVKTVDE